MKRIATALLSLTLWLGACTASPATPIALPAIEEPAAEASPTAEADSQPTEASDQAATKREAVVSEFEYKVAVRAASEGEYILATQGFVIQPGGALQTNISGRARLDFKPEGTIVRIAPNSAFTLGTLEETKGEPKSTLFLFFGKIFVMLNGGSLDVQTPSGVASVRGSVMSVSYHPELGRIQTACLEGVCSLTNDGGEKVYLTEGTSAYLEETNGQIIELQGIDQDEILNWLAEAPELGLFMESLPKPETYPDLEEFNVFTFDALEYYGELVVGNLGVFGFEEETFFSGENSAGESPTDEGSSSDDSGGEDNNP